MKSEKNRNYVRRCLREAFARGDGAREILRWQWVNAKESHLAARSRDDLRAMCEPVRREQLLAEVSAVQRASQISLFAQAERPDGLRLN